MKIYSLLLSLLLFVGAISASGQGSSESLSNEVTLYLTNGSIVRGKLLSTSDGTISITTPNGTLLHYNAPEVRKIDYGEPVVPPTGRNTPDEGFYNSPYEALTGFYFAAESNTGMSIRPNKPNFGFEEIDLIGGYRFGYYLRAGIGLGGRYYFNNDKVRHHHMAWAMPLFVDFRGEFMPRAQRTVVPYWNMQLGTSLGDGFMLRPTIGIRVGESRSAFLLGLSYTGQSLRVDAFDAQTNTIKGKRTFISFISLKLGYEF